MKNVKIYRKRLPHIQPKNGNFFVTFRIKMQLPEDIAKLVNENYRKNKNQGVNTGWDAYSDYFIEFDNFLDMAKTGPKHLSDNRIAELVSESIHYRDVKSYQLICYSIMPNHVHMIIADTNNYLYKIMKSLKGHTGFKANKILDRDGSFWQVEYYDHLIRNQNDLANHITYTINNPVKAKLVTNWQDWEYTYLNDRYLVGPIVNRTY